MNGRRLPSLTVEFLEPLTIHTVEGAKVRLEAALATPGDLQIDCAATPEVDLSGAQLLLSAAKSALRDGRGVSLVGPSSAALKRTLSRAGLVEAFERLLPTAGSGAAR